LDGKSLRKPHLVTPNPRGPSPGNTEEMVGEEKGAWEERERRAWEQPHPRKEVRNPKKGTEAFPHGFHMVSTWLSRISIYRGLTQAERGDFFSPEEFPPGISFPSPQSQYPLSRSSPEAPLLRRTYPFCKRTSVVSLNTSSV